MQHLIKRTLKTSAKTLSTQGANWSAVPMGPPDAIIGITEPFNKCQAPEKMNLGVGAYRDDNGKPFVLPSIREAERRIFERQMNKEYLGIIGLAGFKEEMAKLAFADAGEVIAAKRYTNTQTISGTGALRVGGEFLARFHSSKDIYLPTPSWGNHNPIMRDSGLNVKSYAYYQAEGCKLNFDAMISDLKKIPENSIVMLHACAHNPTGVDPTPEQWVEICEVIKAQKLLPFFDMAYQGFASGSVDNDAFALRHFIDQGLNVVLAQSCAKNFGLYGERAGAFTVVCKDAEEAQRVESQIKILIRPMYSNPPFGGARLVNEILTDENLKQEWFGDVKGMADRIINMRAQLTNGLIKFGSSHDWSHINNQIGMFCFTGMTKDQVIALRDDWHVYMTLDGRISVAGISSNNVEYLAEAMHDVTK